MAVIDLTSGQVAEGERQQPRGNIIDLDTGAMSPAPQKEVAPRQEQIMGQPEATAQQAPAATPQQTLEGQILSPRSQQLPEDQRLELTRALQTQRQAVGAPIEDLGPASATKGAQALERLRQDNPELASLVEDTSPAEAAAIGFQTGLRTLGRGAGKVVGADVFEDIKSPAIKALKETSRAARFGELAGEVAPFAAISPFAALPRTITGRAAAGGALGGTEGAAISAGKDKSGTEIALSTGLSVLLGGSSEVLLPVINRAMRKRAGELGVSSDNVLTPDGQLIPEVKARLQEKGIDEKSFIKRALVDADITKEQKKSIVSGLDEAKLPETGLPATRGEVLQAQGSKDAFAQLKTEQQILESSGEAGDQLRALKLKQSQEADKLLRDLSPGDASLLGPSVRDAIELRESSARFARSEAYKKLGEVTKDLDVGLSVRGVNEAMPEPGIMADFAGVLPNQSNTLNNLLSEFGITQAPANFAREVTPVNVSNYERLRKRLGAIEKADPTGQTSVIVGPIRGALDDEFDIASRALEATGEASVAQAAKEARLSNVALKTEFDEKGMVNQLIAPKARGSNIPKIEDSNIYNKLIADSTPIEQFSSVVKSLGRAASKGKTAKDQIKSRMMLDLIDSGFQAKTRKIQGQQVFGATAFANRLDKIRPKLEAIMSPAEMHRLDAFARDAKTLIPPGGTTPKGSAGFFIDALDKMGVWSLADKVAPGVGGVVAQQLKMLGRSFKNEKDVARALKAPKIKETVQLIQSEYPALSAALLPAIVLAEE